MFLFQVMFMDTAATIPTVTLAERWRFTSFLAFTFLVSTIIYPVYGNWVWGMAGWPNSAKTSAWVTATSISRVPWWFT